MRRQCLKQHLESSFFGSAGEGGERVGGWVGREEGRSVGEEERQKD